MKELWEKNQDNQRTDPAGYIGKTKVWEKEDEKLEAQGRPNPFKELPPRASAYLSARAELNQNEGIVYKNKRTQEVADRVKELIANDTYEGVSENHALTEARSLWSSASSIKLAGLETWFSRAHWNVQEEEVGWPRRAGIGRRTCK